MKSTKQQLVEAIISYFSEQQRIGLCYFLEKQYSSALFDEMEKLALEWKYSSRDSLGGLSCYFIPKSKNDLTPESAVKTYNRYQIMEHMEKQPMRREFANFMLHKLCRELEIPLVQIPKK